MNSNPKPTVGWREWLSLPELSIPGIKAKIDTGARSSALHTHDYAIESRDGEDWVVFHLHPLTHRDDVLLTCEAPVSGFREVRDSGGHVERRPFLRTKVCLGEYTWEIDLSLTNREGMKFRMLLGREGLTSRFHVDPSRSYLLGKSLKRLYGK